jgi:hypothetical protein
VNSYELVDFLRNNLAVSTAVNPRSGQVTVGLLVRNEVGEWETIYESSDYVEVPPPCDGK